MKTNNNIIWVIAQAFYGNRTAVQVGREDIDRFILGYMDSSLPLMDDDIIDRSVISVPDTDDLVIIYNKYQEEKRLEDKERYFKEDGYVLKPLAEIPELGIAIYSRCIVCRMNENGELESVKPEDGKKFFKFLAN